MTYFLSAKYSISRSQRSSFIISSRLCPPDSLLSTYSAGLREIFCFSSFWSKSARASSVLISSMSASGVMCSCVLATFGLSKIRTTGAMASTCRICDKNWLPSPSPSDAPLTKPAMSTNSTAAGTSFSDWLSAASFWRRSSGTATTPTDGSMVANGELATKTLFFVRALKRVDLPTLGNPTIPIERAMRNEYTLLSALGKPGYFAAPIVFEPLGCLVGGAHARQAHFKSCKPEYPFFNFVGVVAEQQHNKERMRAGEYEQARGFALHPLVPAECLLARFIFAHIKSEPRQPHAVEDPF